MTKECLLRVTRNVQYTHRFRANRPTAHCNAKSNEPGAADDADTDDTAGARAGVDGTSLQHMRRVVCDRHAHGHLQHLTVQDGVAVQ